MFAKIFQKLRAITHSRIDQLAIELSEKNELLEEQNQELQAQNEEILAQSEELKDLNNELAEKTREIQLALASAEARAHELSVLWEVGKAITASLDFKELVSQVEDQVNVLLDADASSICIYDERRENLLYYGGKQLLRISPVPEHVDQCESIAAQVAQTGEPQVISDLPNCEHCKYSGMACADAGTHHMLCVPMIHKGKPVGTINAFRQNKNHFTNSDQQVLSTLASVAAVAFENSRAYERQHRIAEKLQRSLLPRENFSIPGFTVGCRYTPASLDTKTDTTKIGGDLYDVVELGGGKTAVVIADVSGKGIDAAIYTAMVKYILRGFLLANPDPCEALFKLNNSLFELAPPEIFVTLFLGILDTEKQEMLYVNAGHDQPLFYSCSKGCCLPCDVTGRALGMLPDGAYTSRKIKFVKGDMVVMYTDGITDARQNGNFLGVAGLENLLYRHTDNTVEEIVNGVFEGVIEFASDSLNDDAAVMVVKAC